MPAIWEQDSTDAWKRALAAYPDVIAHQGVARLPELDRWYREQLPASIASRDPMSITHDDLVRVTEWKMARGVWRARNLALVKGNEPQDVVDASRKALASAPDPRAPITALASLAGVGPATASAVASAAFPDVYPFFDELVAGQVPELGPVAYTLACYVRYAEALRARAGRLGSGWTPTAVERAMWASVGGKAGVAPA